MNASVSRTQPAMSVSEPVPGAALLHPWTLAAFGLIVFNDWVLKKHWVGWWSGKLSDFGICFLLPVVLVALIEWLQRGRSWLTRKPWRPAHVFWRIAACSLTVLYFTMLQASTAWATWHTQTLHRLFPRYHFVVSQDMTDLIALPMVLLSWQLLSRYTSPETS